MLVLDRGRERFSSSAVESVSGMIVGGSAVLFQRAFQGKLVPSGQPVDDGDLGLGNFPSVHAGNADALESLIEKASHARSHWRMSTHKPQS